MKKRILLIIAIAFLCSCNINEPLGKFTDTIGMEHNQIEFGPKNDTVTFKTTENHYILHPDYNNWAETHNFTYINTSYDTANDTLYYDWVKIVALKNEYTVKVIVFDNKTGTKRSYEASLQDRGYIGYLKIYQD